MGVRDDFGADDFFRIVGFIGAVAIFLLLLRLACNLAIDICILGDLDAARRTLIEHRDRYFPCFKRRMVSPEEMANIENNPTNGDSEDGSAQAEAETFDALLTGLSLRDRQAVLDAALPCKIVSSHDITEWRGKEAKPDSCEDSQSSTAGVTCSICLNEIDIGCDAVVTKPCSHVFHHHCLVEWLTNHYNACPVCRSTLVSRADVERTVGRRPFWRYR